MHFTGFETISPTTALFLLTTISLIAALEIDNGLIGEPEVECGSHQVELQFRTKKSFSGKVFVKGHYNEESCRVRYSGGGSNRPTGGIVVPHGDCGMDRQRLISPKGMQFSAVIVVSFHPTFITKVDRAFHVKCMYRELSQTVTAGISVSPLTTEVLPSDFPMPLCTYTIRKDEIDGEVLKYARVGEQVVHRWECQSDIYGILVHSCHISDGQGDKVEVIDSKGCHVDRFLLGDPTYVDNLNLAYRESHVFKFADRVAVRFQCQIRLCMKEGGGCDGVTPPYCDDGRTNLREISRVNKDDVNSARSSPLLSERKAESNEALAQQVLREPSLPSIEGRKTEQNVEKIERQIGELSDRRTESKEAADASANSNNRTPLASPLLAPRRTEIVDDLGSRFFKRRRFFKRSAPNSDMEPKFAPIDGDFVSQYIYVLESTETPQPENAKERKSFQDFLRRTNGIVVGNFGNNVCLSTATFSILLASVCLVLLSVGCVAAIMFCQKKHKHSAKGLVYETASSRSSTY